MEQKQKQKRARRLPRPRGRGQTKNSATHRRGLTAQKSALFTIPIFQSSRRVKLRYVDYDLSVTGTSGVIGNYFFTVNGCFDPNITGAGHQPLGFDQMMLFFEQYTVINSKITINFMNSSSANTYTAVALSLQPDTTGATVVNRLIENGLVEYRWLTPIGVYGSIGSMNLSCDVGVYFGRPSEVRTLLNDVSLSGNAAGNPTEQAYFCVSTFDPIGSNTAVTPFWAIIEYDVVFWEPRKITES